MFKFRLSLKDKLTILIGLIIFICIAIVSLDSYIKARNTLMENLRGDLKDMAQSLSLTIPPAEIKTVLAGDENSKAYWDMKKKLNSFTKLADGKIHEAYVMIPSPKKDVWLFVADNELKDKDNMVGFKEEYDISEFEEMKKSILIPAADKEITEDKWGRWLSGYAPIFDEHTRPFAIFGIDMQAADVEKLKRDIFYAALFYFAIGLAFSLALGRIGAVTITGPILALQNGVKELRARNYGTRIDIERNDEIGDLVRAFNEMSGKLNEVDKIKADFLSVISHELYTPLTPILGGAETLKSITGLSEELKQVVTMIERQAKKMQDLIDDVLDFSWLEIKDLKLRREPVDVRLTTEEVINQLQPAIQKKEIDLAANFEEGLPTIVADKKRLMHTVKILLENAVKFTPEKGKVEIKIAKTADTVQFKVTDSGIGIAPENLARIFERFFQAEDHMTRTKGGLGLGLAIAKRIVEAHGGSIKAESPGPGMGSSFSFTLPIFV